MTHRLLAVAADNWAAFDGLCASKGIDPLVLRPDRFFNLIWWWLTENLDAEARRDLEIKVWMPPEGEEAPAGSPWSAESEAANFASFSAQFEALASPAPEA